MKSIKLLTVFIAALFLPFSAQAIERDLGDNWCSDVRIHFFAGGAEGDGFAGIVQTGLKMHKRYWCKCRNFIILNGHLKE